MKRFFKVTALALVAAFMIESDAQAAFAAGAPEAEEVFETSDYTWTGDEGEGDSISTESVEELESRYTVSGTDARKPFGVGPISPTQVEVKEDGGVISVTNKAGFDIYAAPVEQSLVSGTQKGIAWVNGYKVKNGETRLVYSGYEKTNNDRGFEKKDLEKGKTYTVFAGTFAFLGIGITEYEDEGKTETYWDEDVTNIATITLANAYDKSGLPADGSEIAFKAVSQKNGNVKLSWKPAKALKYKAYSLFRLNTDESSTDEWTPVVPSTTRKSYTDKKTTRNNQETGETEIAAKSALYKLVCTDRDGATKEYIAAATPRLYYAETGYMDGYAEFCISAYEENEDLAYVTMTAGNKNAYKEGSVLPVAKIVTGAQEAGFPIDYNISTKAKVLAVRPDHNTNELPAEQQLVLGNNAVYRASTCYSYKGKVYESGLSNSISRKVGPRKCYVSMIGGIDPAVYYKNYDTHIDPETGRFIVSGLQSAHFDSEGTCYKEGYVTFYGIPNNQNVTRYELMGRKGSQYGSYKVLKKYSVSKGEVTAINNNDGLYYVKYNNFPPEQDWYYAVRAVYGKKAAGGFGDGHYNRTEFEQVQNMLALDTGKGNCEAVWLNDKCAKEYWVYRAEGEIEYDRATGTFYRVVRSGAEGEDAVANMEEITGGLGAFSYVGKVKGSKKRTINGEVCNYFVDKKVKVNQEYTWIVRPVYNTKASKTLTEDMLSYLSDASSASASIMLDQASSVKVSKYSVGQLKVSWSSIKKIEGYEIQWTTSKSDLLQESPGVDVITAWDKSVWPGRRFISADTVKKNDGKPYCLIEVEPGTKTYFRVRGYVGDPNDTTEKNKTCWDVLSFGAVKSSYRGGKKTANGIATPMPVKNLSVSRRSGNEFGDYYRLGAKVAWNINDHDSEYLRSSSTAIGVKDIGYVVTYMGKDGSTVTRKGTLSSTSGASITDDEPLARGVTRTYDVKLYYKDGKIYGDSRKVSYNKPKGLCITDTNGNEVSSITLAPDNSEYTLRVYAYTDPGKKTSSQATVRDLEKWESDNKDVVEIVNKSDSDGYTSITIKAKKKGTAKIYVNAYDSGWTDGADGDNLRKTLTVTVK